VVVELTDHLYPISGKVTDANGALVRDCFVIVFGQTRTAGRRNALSTGCAG